MRLLVLTLASLLLFSCGQQNISDQVVQLPEKVDYNFHIKPILSDRCYTCHGPDDNTREAGLRLDTEEGAFSALEDSVNGKPRFALVGGDLNKSLIHERIHALDSDVMMPPPESNLSLNDLEKALISKWIEQGAEWKAHWSFIPPAQPKVPRVKEIGKVRNPIDHFVLAKLEGQGRSLSPEAEKSQLIRRLSFDLTGLPPRLEEIDAFLADSSDDAYETIVDQYLHKTAYGERMASEWLDVARYADSHGYQDDGMRNMWPWRDWVIKAFNQNIPYDQFVSWQMAGDLLEKPTQDQVLATAFNRNHLQTQEGGVVPEEYRVEYVVDRTSTFGKAFLGLTMECARCHDHKYDPISQKEFYQLYSFFNSINETGQIPYSGESSPTMILTDREVEEKRAMLQKEMAQLNQTHKEKKQTYQQGFEEWLEQQRASKRPLEAKPTGLVGHYPLDNMSKKRFKNQYKPANYAILMGDPEQPPQAVNGKYGGALALNGESFIGMSDGKEYWPFDEEKFEGHTGVYERNQPFSISIWLKSLKNQANGPIVARTGGLFNGNRGYDWMLEEDGRLSFSLNHVFPNNSIKVRTKERITPNQWNHLLMAYDGSSQASGIRLFLNGKAMELITEVDNLYLSVLFFEGEYRTWGHPGYMVIGKRGNEEALQDVWVDECKVFKRELTEVEALWLAGEKNLLSQWITSDPMDPETRSRCFEYYLHRVDTAFQHIQEKLLKSRRNENDLLSNQPQVMVMADRTQKRNTFVLNRGQYDQPTDQVDHGTPTQVMAWSGQLPDNRLGLSQWLFHKDHPLTARVFVNRLWQMVFGMGIVKTPDDFGSQGALPSHPDLLDWLAKDFMAKGWDIKAALKQMVMSATYRQSSYTSPESLEWDPDNRWLARAPSYRLSAEMIRDNALAASGLLVPIVGGPSVKPYQPPGLWKQLATRNTTEYIQQHGDSLYRRGLYTFWKRTTPPPSMMSFDATERNFCEVRRQRTSSPLQALILMNDPQYVEAARILAERVLEKAEPALEAQIDHAFRLLTSRYPDQQEKEILMELYKDQLEYFQEEPDKARELLETGEYPYSENWAIAELAAHALVASTIMNSDASVMKR